MQTVLRFCSQVFLSLVLVLPMTLGQLIPLVLADGVICPANDLVNGFCRDDSGTSQGIVRFEFTGKNYYRPGFPSGQLNYITGDGLTVDVTRQHAANLEKLEVMNLTAFSVAPINRNAGDYWGGCTVPSASEGDADGKTTSITCSEPANGAGDDIYFVFTDLTDDTEFFYHVNIADKMHSFSDFKVNGQNVRNNDTVTVNNNDTIYFEYGTETPAFNSFELSRSFSQTGGITVTKQDSTTAEYNCSNGALTKDNGDPIPEGTDNCGSSSPSGSETLAYCADPAGNTGTVNWSLGVGDTAGDDAVHSFTLVIVDSGGDDANGCGVVLPICGDNSINQGFEVCDGTDSSPGFSCNASCTNHLPIAQSQQVTIASDNNDPVEITLTSTDADSQTHVFTTDDTGTEGNVGADTEGNESSGTRTSTLTYTPPVDFEAGDTDSFTFTVGDGIDGSGTATVSIVKASSGGGGRRVILACPAFNPFTSQANGNQGSSQKLPEEDALKEISGEGKVAAIEESAKKASAQAHSSSAADRMIEAMRLFY